MKYFISITVILFLLICTWSCALKVHEKHLYKTEVEAVHSGTIVDKKIVNPEMDYSNHMEQNIIS